VDLDYFGFGAVQQARNHPAPLPQHGIYQDLESGVLDAFYIDQLFNWVM
jgi:hypothetical protein